LLVKPGQLGATCTRHVNKEEELDMEMGDKGGIIRTDRRQIAL
jgi:hypothetical protein